MCIFTVENSISPLLSQPKTQARVKWSLAPSAGGVGDMQAALDLYKEALSLARAAGDEEAVEQIQEGLMEVKKRREEQLKETEEEEEVDLK